MDISLSNVINISVSEAQQGVGAYNVNNLALFTNDAGPGDPYTIYLDPSQVATDFGSSSKAYEIANAVFAQAPNMLAGGGYLAVIPFIAQIQSIQFDAIPVSGQVILSYNGSPVATITSATTAATLQTALRTHLHFEHVTVTGSIASGQFLVTMTGYYNSSAVFTTSGNTFSPTTAVDCAQERAGESLATAITRTAGLVQYFGVITDNILDSTNTNAAAAVLQPLNKMGFFPTNVESAIAPDGYIAELAISQYTHSRGLYYGNADDEFEAVLFGARYAGRALSTNFSGSNTTSTMHLKGLIGQLPDPTMTQTILDKCIDAGADSYISLQGVAKVYCSGANKYFDQVYNLCWFVGALQVSTFNYLAQSDTKIPQTEPGMVGFKGAIRAVCQQAVNNQYLAPGQWNSSTTFGNQLDFLSNVSQLGYYIYSLPISQQSQVDREARKAPLCQVAVKEAGSIQSASVLVYVNA